MAPDGTLAWTAITTGELRYETPQRSAAGSGSRSARDSQSGRKASAATDGWWRPRPTWGHALYEHDPTGAKPRRLIMKDDARSQ